MDAVTVRAGALDDLPALTAIYNHHVVTGYATFDIEPFTVGARQAWFGHYAASGPHRLLVAERDAQVIGYATSSEFRAKPAYRASVETTVYLEAAAGGNGVGSALYRELFAQLAGEDVHRAYAGIALPNDASVALHRRFGFEPVGTFGEVGRKFDRWIDVAWFGTALGPR